jgi:hypothetical protein
VSTGAANNWADLGYPITFVGCRVDAEDRARGLLFPRGLESPKGDPVEVRDGALIWHLPPWQRGSSPAAEGILALDGHAPVWISWADAAMGVARCTPATVPLAPVTTTLSGDVASPYARRHALSVVGCGGQTLVRPDGTFELPVLPDEPCEVWARREDGVPGLPVEVDPTRSPVHLSAVPQVLAITGVDAREDRRGVRIEGGGPGPFEPGDLVVSLDGRRLKRDPLVALGRAMLGLDPSGQRPMDHELVVRRDGVEVQVQVRRSVSPPVGAAPTPPR